MAEWNEFVLSEIFEPVKNQYRPRKGDNLPYIGLEHIQQQSLRLDGIGSSDNISSQKFFFDIGDVLFGKLRPYFRKVVSVNFKGVCSTDIWVLRSKNGHSQKFIKYFVATNEFIETCNAGESGTRMPRADWNYLKDTVWFVPEFDIQENIAEVLSSLDDKIDLLHRQNKTLEQMAETLFRQWFVEEEKDEWVETTIDQVALINPETISKKFEFTRIEYLDTGSITKGSIESFLDVDLSDAPSRAQRRVIDNDMVFSLVRPNQCHYGLLNGTKPNTIVSTGFCVIRANKISPYFIYYLLTNQTNIEYLHSIAEGSTSTYPSLRPEDIAKFTFNFPSENKCNAFHEHVSGYWEKIFANQRQIKKLESMRETLLPKLMNGTVLVTNN